MDNALMLHIEYHDEDGHSPGHLDNLHQYRQLMELFEPVRHVTSQAMKNEMAPTEGTSESDNVILVESQADRPKN